MVSYRLYYWIDKTVKEDLIFPFSSYIRFHFKESYNLVQQACRPCRPWVCRVCQILADQLTLFQPGGTDYAHLITTGTPGFSDLPTALEWHPPILAGQVTLS